MFFLFSVCFGLVAIQGVAAAEQDQKQSAANSVESPQTSVSTPDPAVQPTEPSAIEIIDVPAKAAEVTSFLRSLANKKTSDAQVEVIRKSLPQVTQEVDGEMEVTLRLLQRHLALPTLQAQQQKWQQIRKPYDDWLDTLKQRSTELQSALNQLNGQEKTWTFTIGNIQNVEVPEPILQLINETIATIRTAKEPLNKKLALLLGLQSKVGEVVLKCDAVLEIIAQKQQSAMSGILVQDSLPVWDTQLWIGSQEKVGKHFRDVLSSFAAHAREYVYDPDRKIFLHASLLVVMVTLFLWGRAKIRGWGEPGEKFSPALEIFNHPLAAAITLSLLIVTSPYVSSLPTTISSLFQVLAFIPMIILIRPYISGRLLFGLYVLGLLLVIDAGRETFIAEYMSGQVFLIVEALVGLMLMTWFVKNIRKVLEEKGEASGLRIYQFFSILASLFFALGFAAAAMGYMRIAALLVPGLIAAGMLALTLFASLRIVMGIVAFAFQVWPLRDLKLVQQHRIRVEKQILRLLIFLAMVGLVVRYLQYIGLLEAVIAAVQAIFQLKFERGTFSLSLGRIVEFFLVVWVAFVMSALIRFVLQEEIYPRIKITPGKSYAVSRLLHYFILAIGFTAAIAALGMDLTKLTVLTGALGIGIGFGLQSVVNNFVSGLILMFERPIQVGDIIEVDGLLCRVQRIGIRGSVIRTRSGADIIIPNSQLIAERVTNWTHSDQMKRIDLPVGLSYGCQPESVINLLEAAASQHPDISRHPPPQGLFTGFGDSSINFEIRAWTEQFDDWRRVKSELGSAIFSAVQAAGMTIPFPQREVRLLQDHQHESIPADNKQEKPAV